MTNWLVLAALMTASPWSDLEVGNSLRLTQAITLGESGPKFPENTRLVLSDIEPLELPGAPMVYLHLRELDCAHPDWRSDIEIVLPRGNPEASAVGVELAPNCRWGIFVEQKDLLQPSFLAPSNQ